MYLKPKEGMSVPDPVLRDFLPPEGRLVEPSEHWTRIVRDGDAELVEQPAAPVDEGSDA
ncbi:Protein of unknown function [Roseomonas rosea]|uniref:DUF2635 domain-containing protein n=1 Tax=Muricoccus roseus TaxID=198092 RepID=A0A1M6LDB1_9PROT|nr:DUF2635 domain-containing protein [Roseomonas rosea]SHJ69075.1 Protein of unknown function [Roseomonas rosea]